MPQSPEHEYGHSMRWEPERPRWRVFPLLVTWLVTGVALMVAAAILPGVNINDFGGRCWRRRSSRC